MGFDLSYAESGGSGAAVVFLHPGTLGAAGWKRQLEAFAQAGYRAIAYDRRGYGASHGEPGGPAADDLARLLDHLSVERAHLVGSAAGAMVAIDFALSHPGRARSLVVANSHGGLQDDGYVALQRRLRPAPHFEALPPEVRELGPSYRAANPEGVDEWIALERSSRAPGTATLPKTRNRLTFAMLETLKMPVLFLGGDADLYAPPPVLRLFAARVKGSRAVVLAECGHSAFWEQPERFNAEVLAFIEQY